MCCTPTSITCITALRSVKQERQLNSATWRDSCTLDDTGFGELESVSLRRLLVSALILAPSCGCCLPPLFSLDQDETEWDSALFLLHPPHHTHMLDVGLPLASFYLTLKLFPGVEKMCHCDSTCGRLGSFLCPSVGWSLSGSDVFCNESP